MAAPAIDEQGLRMALVVCGASDQDDLEPRPIELLMSQPSTNVGYLFSFPFLDYLQSSAP